MVLEASSDISQCCMTHRQPAVKAPGDTAFLAEMMGRFVEVENSTTTLRWRRGVGLSVTADGFYGFGEAYKNETIEALFVHFLQWKYTCGEALASALRGILDTLRRRGQTPFDLECLDLVASFKHRIDYRLC